MSEAEYTCCVGAERVQLGLGRYSGRAVPQWGGLIICRQCEWINLDGIVVATHPDLQPRIEAAGGEVTFNREGHIAIPPFGSN